MSQTASATLVLRHQRAELGRAEIVRGFSLLLQLAVALVAAISVFFSDGLSLVRLGGLGVVLLCVWLWTDNAYRRHRSCGEQARRLLQVRYGLDQPVAEISHICAGFLAPADRLPPVSVETYFATTAPPGMRRLAEMVDESAFFTAAIQRHSGEVMWLILFIGIVAAFLAWLFFAPQLDSNSRTAAVRVMMALAVFLLSSEIIGGAFSHGSAASSMESIRLRISAARGRAFPEGDVLQVMADYNAAVEGAPLPLPLVYRAMSAGLTKRWAEHKAIAGIGT